MDLNLEAAAIVLSGITQPFEGAGLRVLYLAKRVRCQLVGEDALQVPINPPIFMLAPLSMTDVKYQLWRSGIPYTQRVSDELDYGEFNDTHLMPFLTPAVLVLPSLSYIFFLCISPPNDIHMGCSCQASPAVDAPLHSPRLPWLVYVYGLDGFARERAVGLNTNAMGYLWTQQMGVATWFLQWSKNYIYSVISRKDIFLILLLEICVQSYGTILGRCQVLILYFVPLRFACRTLKTPKILFSLHGAASSSKMTWCNLFGHRSPQNAFFS